MKLLIAGGMLILSLGAGTRTAAAQAQPVQALPLVKWTRLIDPAEGAFSIDVPAGWNNTGRLLRYNALQYISYETTISPNGASIVGINNPNLVSYEILTPMLAQLGFRVGSIYDGGGGTRYIVAPYLSGQQFALWYGQAVLPSYCTGLRVTASAPRSDISQRITQFERSLGISIDAGEASFTCSKNGMPMVAYVFAQSNAVALGTGGGFWYGQPVLSFLAPSALAGAVAGMLSHMYASVQINPQWVQRQEQTNMAVSEIATQTEAVISQGIMTGYENREATLDKVMDEGERARLGIDYYADPATGQQYVVSNTANYYWVDAQGNVVGTSTDTSPGAGYTNLQRVPPQ